MEILITSFLVIVTAILVVLEVFIVPGISIAGLSALLCGVYAVYYSFTYIGVTAGIVTIAALVFVTIGALWIFMKSNLLDKLALKKEVSSTIEKTKDVNVKVGDKGISTTRLALIGYAEFDGKVVEVKAANDLIDPNTEIVVERIVDGIILVEKTIK